MKSRPWRIELGVVLVGLPLLLLLNFKAVNEKEIVPLEENKPQISEAVVREYLKSKGSPLADYTDVLLQQPNWKLLVAISHIESSWCTKQIDYNCWGIGGDSAYRHYKGYPEAIKDAGALIDKWQAKGRWLTIDDMNCHYVVPCNENWVRVVTSTLNEINNLK